MAAVELWTGHEARALRLALRMSVREFAARLGVGQRTVSDWEKLGADTQPRPNGQAILDTALEQAGPAVHVRFQTLLGRDVEHPARAHRRTDHEAWAEDIERAAIEHSRQSFATATDLLNHWLSDHNPNELDDQALYLYGRTLTLIGAVQVDQGTLLGPHSAASNYTAAREVFHQLDVPRRVGQIELALGIITEMSGRLEAAARRYQALAVDERLSARDRGRARLWVGTALSKAGRPERAIPLMTAAARDFEHLGEHDDWSSSQQKIALAHRAAGDLTSALRFIDIARTNGRVGTPLQRVQLDTATAHILLSDPACVGDGRATLAGAARIAEQYGLGHQLQSIRTISDTTGNAAQKE